MSVSRQRKWQIQQKAKGLCSLCAEPIGPHDTVFCVKHREASRERSRRVYRAMNGLPDDAPLLHRGRQKLGEPPHIPPEEYYLLGTNTDKALSEWFGCPLASVTYMRKKLKIKPFRKHSKKKPKLIDIPRLPGLPSR